MKSFRSSLAIVVGIVAALGSVAIEAGGESPTPENGAQRRALLIGIDEYRSPSVPDLLGASNDVALMRRVLRTRHGFGDIRTLTNADATRDGILDAMRRLVADCGPDDVAYVHYSGHGAQVADLNGDEDDALDETLVPHDARTDGVADIVDDELDALFASFRTPHVVVVFDSCHSGTALRFGSPGVTRRFASSDDRMELYKAIPQVAQRGWAGTRPSKAASVATLQILTPPIVAFASAAPEEPALGAKVDGTHFGLFTRAFALVLARANDDLTVEEALELTAQEFRRIAQTVTAEPSTPRVDALEDRLSQPLWPATLDGVGTTDEPPARTAWLEAKVTSDGRVVLVDGAVLGAGEGSAWALFANGDTDLRPGAALACGIARERDGDDCLLEIVDGGDVPNEARAVLVAPAPAPERIPVRLRGGARYRAATRAALDARVRGIDWVDHARFAQFVVASMLDDHAVYGAGGSQELLARGTLDEVAAILSRARTAQALLALDHPATDMTLRVSAVGHPRRDATVASRKVTVVATGAKSARYRIAKPGERFGTDTSLQLEVECDADAYLTIVSVDSQGGVMQLFPFLGGKPDFLPNGKIDANRVVRIPDRIPATPDESNDAGFHFPYGPPAGLDSVRVFAARDLATAERIRGALAKIGVTSEAPPANVTQRRVTADGVLDRLRDELIRRTTRGFTLVEKESPASDRVDAPSRAGLGDWAAVSLAIEVSNE